MTKKQALDDLEDQLWADFSFAVRTYQDDPTERNRLIALAAHEAFRQVFVGEAVTPQ
jgi:hypothetical protein